MPSFSSRYCTGRDPTVQRRDLLSRIRVTDAAYDHAEEGELRPLAVSNETPMRNDLPDDLQCHLIYTARYLLGRRVHESDDRMLSYIKRNAKRCLFWNRKLFRRSYRGLRVIVLQQERVAVLRSFYDEMGHWDLETIKQFIVSRYWWPTIGRDIFDYVRSCTGFQHASPLP